MGRSHAVRCPFSWVHYGKLLSSYLMQGNWDKIAQDACGGFVTVFTEYFEPDIPDEVEAFTITNVQPHAFGTHMASNFSDAYTQTQATQGPFQDKWWEAMGAELNTIENELHAWE